MELRLFLRRSLVIAGAVALMTGCGSSSDPVGNDVTPDAVDDTAMETAQEVCTPDCAGKECGDDGCGNECGKCTDPQTCNAGKCEDPVLPKDQCTNAEDGAVIAADPDAPLAITGACVVNLCLANPTLECVVDCVQNGSDKTTPPITGLALSDGCAGCYGASSLCGVDQCLSECIADTSAPECGACLAEHCLPAFYECSGLPQGCSLPTVWDVAAVVDTAMVPADGALCPDFSGDSIGDNGLAASAVALNDILGDMSALGAYIIFEFAAAGDLTDVDPFTLNGLVGEMDGADYKLDPLSYDPDTCDPLIQIATAKIAGGALEAGPADFTLVVPVQGETVQFALTTGSVTGTVGAGPAITDGIIAGVLSKADAEAVVAQLKAICAANGAISWCTYVPVLDAALPLVFDLDTDDDQVPDAVSLCLQFTASAGTITGIL